MAARDAARARARSASPAEAPTAGLVRPAAAQILDECTPVGFAGEAPRP